MPFEPEIKSFLEHIAVERGLASNTVQSYRRDLRLFGKHCARRKIESVRRIDMEVVAGFVAFLQSSRNYAPSSAVRSLAAVRTFLRFLMGEGILKDDPGELIERPRQWRRLPRVLSKDEARRLTNAPWQRYLRRGDWNKAHWKHRRPARKLLLRDQAIVELFYASGIRVSELCDLPLDGLSLDAGIVRVTGKGGKTRLVPVGRAALKALECYLRLARPELAAYRKNAVAECARELFLSRTGKRLAREDVWALVKIYGRRSALHCEISPHTLRHSFGTHLMEGGANLRAVQEMLGHSSLSTTEIYTYVDARRMLKMHRQYHPRGKGHCDENECPSEERAQIETAAAGRSPAVH